jgi:hypothetical protein
MQPLSREVREALKRRHPGLRDETIDRAEELLALRVQLDPERHAGRIAELDRERAALLAREMPHYREVVHEAARASSRRTPESPQEPDVTVTPAPPGGATEAPRPSPPGLQAPKGLFRRPVPPEPPRREPEA